jgi:saccharopine dehydrogenase (NADP+, L-glutamate forming)/spermidine synthase
MKNVLILGAGLVARPGVKYLLDQKDLFVTVASRTLSKAEAIIASAPNGKAIQIDVENRLTLSEVIKQNDIVVSLLPWTHHVRVAELCLEFGKNMVTTSYISEGMKAMDKDVKAENILFLNEVGLDPGIDHMSAMRIIDSVHKEGGKIVEFYSYCGGLPAPEANDNPFGYKFSWSPRGVVLASRNSAKFLKNGEIIEIPGKDLFLNYRVEEIEELGSFEVYPNRDSTPYKELYGLKDALTVQRGTYRNLGWCETLKKIVDLGLVDETPLDTLNNTTYIQMMAGIAGCRETDDVFGIISEKLELKKDSDIMKRLEWLGLFSNEDVGPLNNKLDILCGLMQKKLKFFTGDERDMVLLRHKFTVENPDSTRDIITSTLIDYGIAGGDSSMSRTVSLPMAMAVSMIADGTITATGVRMPNTPDIYGPILSGLSKLGITMTEKRFAVELHGIEE